MNCKYSAIGNYSCDNQIEKFTNTPLPVSTNGKCGPITNTKCPGTQCCDKSGVCGGSNTTKSIWCSNNRYYGGMSPANSITPTSIYDGTPLVSQVTASSLLKVTTTGRCGPNNGNTKCTGNTCCSNSGFCGGDSNTTINKWCSTPFVPPKYYGSSSSLYDGIPLLTHITSASSLKLSTNGKCGPNNSNTKCPGNQCCNSGGVCGGSNTTNDTWCTNISNIPNKYYGISNGIYDASPPTLPFPY